MIPAHEASPKGGRPFAWLHNFRRLRTRYERRAELHLAFMQLGCAVICQRALRTV
jgi:transposase